MSLSTHSSSRESGTTEKCESVTWTGIQADLQHAQSDALILLDCCYAGTVVGGEGNGVTELLAACDFNSQANGVGQYSFTSSLIIELEEMARQIQTNKRESFPIGEIWTKMFLRIQSYIPQGIANERYPPPTHVPLRLDEKFRRCIYLSIHTKSRTEASTEKVSQGPPPEALPPSRKRPITSDSTTPSSKRPCPNKNHRLADVDSEAPHSSPPKPMVDDSREGNPDDTVDDQELHTMQGGERVPGSCHAKANPSNFSSAIPHWPVEGDPCWPSDAPRILLAVRLTDNIRYSNLSPESWVEWLRTMPGVAGIETVHVEAAFKCDSTLLLVSLPMSVWTYFPDDPAIIPLGRVLSSNLIAVKGIYNEIAGAINQSCQKENYSNPPPDKHTESYPKCSWCQKSFNPELQELLTRHVEETYPLCSQCKTRIMPAKEISPESRSNCTTDPPERDATSNLPLSLTPVDSSSTHPNPHDPQAYDPQPSRGEQNTYLTDCETATPYTQLPSINTEDINRNSTKAQDSPANIMKRRININSDDLNEPFKSRDDADSSSSIPHARRRSATTSISANDELPPLRSQPDDHPSLPSIDEQRGSSMNPPLAPNRQLPLPPGRSFPSPTSLSFPSHSNRSYGISNSQGFSLPSPSSIHPSPSNNYLPPINAAHTPDSALREHTKALQHEVSVQKIALSSLQREQDKLLAAFSRSQTRASALEKKHAVSDTEIISLTEEKLRLQALVIELERDVEELASSRDDFRQGAVQAGVQYVEVVKRASRLEEMAGEERKSWNKLKEEMERKIEVLNAERKSGAEVVIPAEDSAPSSRGDDMETDTSASSEEFVPELKMELTSEPSDAPTSHPSSQPAQQEPVQELKVEIRRLQERCTEVENALRAIRDNSRSMEDIVKTLLERADSTLQS